MSKQIRKTAVIIGGTSGIGAAIARVFDFAGYRVIVASRGQAPHPQDLGKKIHVVKADVTSCDDMDGLMQQAVKRTGRLDTVVNCAGFSQWKSIGDIDEEFLDRMLDVNLKGVFWGCKAAGTYLKTGGSIINIASLAGKRGSARNSAYCAAKFGVVGLTQALAKEMGPAGIRVNAVCPVYVHTPGVLRALKDKHSPASGGSVAAYWKEFASTQAALKRLPTADEVAQVCLFLASDAASAVTGQSINVDCGVLPQ